MEKNKDISLFILNESIKANEDMKTQPVAWQEGFLAGCRWMEDIISRFAYHEKTEVLHGNN